MTASLSEEFGPFDRAWVNTAHQGPLPRVAAEAAHRAVEEKVDPRRIAEEAFFDVPRSLRGTLARLIGAEAREVVLGNSTSYGLDLLAHGLPLRPGDEVLLVEGDFPASIYPWLPLQRHGVRLRTLPGTVRSARTRRPAGSANRAHQGGLHELGVLLHRSHCRHPRSGGGLPSTR